MSLSDLKRRFREGAIDKPSYISEMLRHHELLAEYAGFLATTDIERIELDGSGVLFHLRSMPFTMRCAASQARVAPIEILNFDTYEGAETQSIAPLLAGCDTIVDVGANIGWYSLWFAHQRPLATVHAFEPIPDSFAFLDDNVRRNGLADRIKAHRMGLSDSAGTFDFFSYPTGSTNVSMKNVSGAADAVKLTAQTTTLDAWASANRVRPDFIKCDVEGAEFLVFRGAEAVLADSKPIVFTEMLRKWSKPFGYHPNDVIAFFDARGYSCFATAPAGLARFREMTDASVESNFVFLHRERHAALMPRAGA